MKYRVAVQLEFPFLKNDDWPLLFLSYNLWRPGCFHFVVLGEFVVILSVFLTTRFTPFES